MTGLEWLTRVPLSIKEASSLVSSTVALTPSAVKGYSLTEFQSEYGGVSQRWLLIESEQRRQSDLKQLAKKIEQYRHNAQQALQRISTQEFACIADAISAAHNLSRKMTWHQLCDLQTTEKRHYDKAGKPSQTDVPTRISYRVTGNLIPVKEEIDAQRIRCGRFILATNVLNSEQLGADDALCEYKAQQGVERGFRFLKDPMFFASSVFLKSPKRVAALGLIMALCLLVYNLGQRQLRQALAQEVATIPDQLGKPTASPTLRWVFQCFMAVHLVFLQGVKQVVNLTDDRQHILRFFSNACRHYYLLPEPDS
jgi:transposase